MVPMAERFLGQRRYTGCVKNGADPWEHEVISLVSLRDVLLVRKDMSYGSKLGATRGRSYSEAESGISFFAVDIGVSVISQENGAPK